MTRALTLLALTGCSSVAVHAPGLSHGVVAAIDAGLPVTEGADTAIVRVEIREGLKLGGHAYDTHGCVRQAYVRKGFAPAKEAALVAHELGHVLGLGHVDDDTNLMHPEAPEKHGALTPEQRRTAKRARAVLKACEVAQ